MAPEIRIVCATQELARRLAPNLRAADEAEVLAASGETPLEALERSVAASVNPGACLWDGEPVSIWGVVPGSALGGSGMCWMLGAKTLGDHPLLFWHLCKLVTRQLQQEWTLLFNFIDARYEAAVRWARALGFHVDPSAPFGVAGLPFHRVYWRR